MSTGSAHLWGEGPRQQWEEGHQGSSHLQEPGGESGGDPPGAEELQLLREHSLLAGFQSCTGVSHQRALGRWELTSVLVHVTVVVL